MNPCIHPAQMSSGLTLSQLCGPGRSSEWLWALLHGDSLLSRQTDNRGEMSPHTSQNGHHHKMDKQ